jgi:hypothetical protein
LLVLQRQHLRRSLSPPPPFDRSTSGGTQAYMG